MRKKCPEEQSCDFTLQLAAVSIYYLFRVLPRPRVLFLLICSNLQEVCGRLGGLQSRSLGQFGAWLLLMNAFTVLEENEVSAHIPKVTGGEVQSCELHLGGCFGMDCAALKLFEAQGALLKLLQWILCPVPKSSPLSLPPGPAGAVGWEKWARWEGG